MTPIVWIISVIYLIGVMLFLYVGFARTRYAWWIVVPLSLLWLPATVFVNIYERVRRR
jgi:hypothetical protein